MDRSLAPPKMGADLNFRHKWLRARPLSGDAIMSFVVVAVAAMIASLGLLSIRERGHHEVLAARKRPR
jgi:hypothetical protein